MSTTTQKRSWAQANEDGRALRDLFPDACYSLWKSAGSVRRRRQSVGDIEHVIIPAFDNLPSNTLFAEPERTNLLWYQLDALVKKGDVSKAVYGASEGFKWGEKYRGVSFRGFTHELFTADADNFGSVLAIRTGPSDFSRLLVTGLLNRGMRNKDGYVWRCDPCPVVSCDGMYFKGDGPKCPECDSTGLVPVEKIPVPDERTFFELAGVKYLEPEQRDQMLATPAGRQR